MKGKVNVAYRFFFGIRTGAGAPATGLAGSCTITVVAPDGTTINNPSASERGSSGQYYFDIPAAFTLANAAGEYGVFVQVASASVNDVDSDVVEFHDQDLDDLATPTDVKAQADQALVDYDPPTRAEATIDKNEIITEVDANEVKIDTNRKLLDNRQELANGSVGNLVTYDDDDSTPIAASDVTDVNGDPVVLVPGMPARRSRGI